MYKNRIISKQATILDALKKMEALDKKLLIVLNDETFEGLISAGDIQRAIIQNKPLNTQIKQIQRKSIRVARPNDAFEMVKQMMIDFRMELCPVVNQFNEIEKVYFWEDLFVEKKPQPLDNFNLPVVIMAGGKGSRLKPLTNVLPKPMIPVGEKTMLEEIFDLFAFHGCNRFYVSLNYKGDLIEYYIKSLNLTFDLAFLREDQPLGTAGSLTFLKGKINETFFVTNCDILIDQDYSEILEYHRENKNDVTIVAALKHLTIPYGTVEAGDKGILKRLTEKPELSFLINSGMYVLEPSLLAEIPEGKFFHITDLIEKVQKRDGRVGVFPVSENSWKDIGDWDLYINEAKKLNGRKA